MAKKKTTKRPEPPGKKRGGKRNEEVMVEVIKALRENPDKWHRLKSKLKSCKSDNDRAQVLIEFATDDRELAALMPITAGGTEAAAWTTVTVTTIFIADSAY